MLMLTRLACVAAVVAAAASFVRAADAPLWTAPVKGVRAAPVLIEDGARRLVVVAGSDGLVALDARGQEVWRSPAVKGRCDGVAVVRGADGRSRLFAASGKTLVALDAAGKTLWQADLAADATCGVAAAVRPDGRVRVVAGDGRRQVRCFQDGRLLWSFVFQSGQRPRAEDETFDKTRGFWGDYYRAENVTGLAVHPQSPAGAPGVFVAAEFGRVYALDWDGRYLWDAKLPGKTSRSGPVLVQLAGRPTVLVGCTDHNLYALDARTGQRLWSAPATFAVFTPTVGDVDGDGQPEVVYSDENCQVFCVSESGAPKWKADLSKPRVLAYDGRRTLGPARIFHTPEGVRIAVPMKNDRSLPLLDGATGKLAGELPVEPGDITAAALLDGGPVGTALVADLGVGTALIAAGAAAGVKAFTLAGAQPLLAPQPLALSPMKHAASSGQALAVSAPAGLGVGPNELVFRITGYDRPATLVLTVRSPAGAVVHRCDHFAAGQQVTETIDALEPGETRLEAVLLDPASGRQVGEWKGRLRTVSLAAAVSGEIKDLQAAAHSLRTDNPAAAEFLRRQADRIAGEAAALTPAALKSEPASLLGGRAQEIRAELAHLRAGVRALSAGAPADRSQRLQAWRVTDPWERFYPDQLPVGITPPSGPSVSLAQNEYGSGAFNLTNWTDKPLTVRLAPGDFGPAGEPKREIGWRDHLTLRTAQLAPTSRGYYVADALPPLGDAGLVTIAPWQSAQVWLTFQSGQLEPGVYAADIAIEGVTLEPLNLSVPIEMRVRRFALPQRKPIQFCNWAYVETNKWFSRVVEDAVQDMVEHYTSVFPVPLYSPTFTYDQTGAIKAPAEADWAGLDAIVERYHSLGIILFQGEPILKYVGPAPDTEAASKRAYAEAWRAVVEYLNDIGVGYDDWAWYIMDEPGLDRGPRNDYVVKMGAILRSVDPKIRIYTDPVSPNGIPDLERMAPYIDIWQPDQETLAPIASDPKPEFSPEAKAAWFRATGDPVWMYECHPRMKRGHPLVYYRRMAWVAWKFGLTGMGFWTYDTTSHDHWTQGEEYALVYPGEKPIPSKRWEACREGVQDYTYLWLLRSAVEKAEKAGQTSADLDRAKRLLDEAAPELIARNMDYDLLMQYRAEIADLIERL
jgi:outer membrane protein assembly factor BamB